MNTRHVGKGFTLAELLIVAAIIGILVAVSIPVFTSQRQKTIDATNRANIRAAKAAASADYLGNYSSEHVYYVYDVSSGKLTWKIFNPEAVPFLASASDSRKICWIMENAKVKDFEVAKKYGGNLLYKYFPIE